MKTYKGKLSKATLQVAFKEAKENEHLYIGLLIETAGSKRPELIINERENFDTKLEYLKQAYDDRLRLRNAPDKIHISAIMVADRLSDFKYLLLAR